jgi:type IV secretion system protein VirD4
MTPTRLLIGQILIVSAIMILRIWAATQSAAAMLGNSRQMAEHRARTRRGRALL